MSFVISYIARKAIFPIFFTLCLILRPAVLSVPYLVFLLYAPFLPAKAKSKCILNCVAAVTSIIVLLQIGGQITLYWKNLTQISSMGTLGQFLYNIGLTELYNPDFQIFCWCFLLDVLMCGLSIVMTAFLTKPPLTDENVDAEESIDSIFIRTNSFKLSVRTFFRGIALFLMMSTLLIASTLQPSIPSAIYFTTFICITTAWAMNKKMYQTFIGCIWFLCFIMIIHITTIFIFQTTWSNADTNQNSKIRKYFGLMPLVDQRTESAEIDLVSEFVAVPIDVLLNPFAILLCYYTSVIFLRDVPKREVVNSNRIRLEPLNSDELNATHIDDFKAFVKRMYRFACRRSNIASNLIMMIWSIIFRSWLSIVFLLIVTVLWMRPIEQKSAYRINFFIVLYADFLLFLQYFYCMIITNTDVPVQDSTFLSNLAQIGIVRYDSFPCIPLLFKAICTVTFCFTLRQEKLDENRKRESNLTSNSFQINSSEGKTIWKCFYFGLNVLSHVWVLMILLTMFIYAIYGNEMNLLKLCYLVYVLVFVTSYQLSLRIWRKITYGLWMMVVVTSMANLIFIYTYQFSGFDYLWSKYLGIDLYMQTVIGLHHYETKELLIHLFYFTFLVVITAIQILIFHKKCTKQFIWKPTESRANIQRQDSVDEPSNSEDVHKTYLEKVVQGISSFIDVNRKLFDWVCSFLELHLFKVVLIAGFFMSIHEVSAFNLLINVAVVITCCFVNNATNVSSGIITLLASIVITSKVLYHLMKIPEPILDFVCFAVSVDKKDKFSFSSMTFCDVNNTARWLGVYKSDEEANLIHFLGPYLIFIAIALVHSTISYYQVRKRLMKGQPPTRPEVLFEGVTREDADKSVILLVKYLINYGFYKFGIEITITAQATLICVRKDTSSIVYLIWLCVIVGIRRRTKKFIWPIFQHFVTITILLQYVIMLNLPSSLQSVFQWEFDAVERVQSLISLERDPRKLLLDFIVLMCVCRQRHVFAIEKKYGGKKYPGGRNESSVQDIGIIISGQLPIRTHDFLYPTNWLDIIKCIVYFSSYWVTLSVVLFTGTNNVSAFSLGYLISSFLFCYIGTNFYMKSIHSILRWWKLLIAYNIFVITAKSILNVRLVVGGIFSTHHDLASVHTFLSEDKQPTQPLDMSYDCFCFAFLIFQLRIFKSIDFCHIINESKATFVCDSRGTKLLANRVREMHHIQTQRETETLENIKLKVERIKANQQKFEPNVIAAKTHHEAVRYNGKYLYEELVDKAEFYPRQNESTIESEESFLLKNLSRVDAGARESNTSIHNDTQNGGNHSTAAQDEDTMKRSYFMSLCRDLLISTTLYLYKFSRNYRYVHEILSKEKKLLKLKACGDEPGDGRIYFFAYQHSIVSEFFQALWFALIANTDVICYLFIFLNTIISMSVFALPMSLCVCLWATLTLPRPSKHFWLTIIAYTEIMVFVQYFLQIISHFHKIDISDSTTTYNLILLHFVLFHRSVLKHMGIWTFTKKNRKDAMHVLSFLRLRSIKPSLRKIDSIVQIPADVYTFMFLCDLVNFFVLMFGFSAFSQSPADGNVQNYLNEDQIPFRFLLTLLVQFVSLIVDRALYLRRNMKGKILFHIISVIAVHIWQFRFMRLFHNRPFYTVTWPPMVFYFIKCIYFLLPAYQIRCGYPKRVSGNFATNGFSSMHCYQMIPFLSEARTLLDWICIKTSLTLYEWFKMEDIYSDMFVINCRRQYEKSVPRLRGVVRGSKGDYLRAIIFLIAFFVLIWGPWALFTFDHTVGKSNVPYEVRVSLHVGSIEPIYQMTAQSSNIHQFTEQDYTTLQKLYANNTALQSLLSNYDEEDIAAISLDVNSTTLWTVSPPSLQKFIDNLVGNATVKFRYSVSVSRLAHEEASNTVEINQVFYLSDTHPTRDELLRSLIEFNQSQSVHLPYLFPKFLKVMNSKGIQPISHSQSPADSCSYRNMTLHLHENENMKWWELVENWNDDIYDDVLSKLPYANSEEQSVLYTFSDKLYPSSLSPFIGGGIIGLYSTYILLIDESDAEKALRKSLGHRLI